MTKSSPEMQNNNCALVSHVSMLADWFTAEHHSFDLLRNNGDAFNNSDIRYQSYFLTRTALNTEEIMQNCKTELYSCYSDSFLIQLLYWTLLGYPVISKVWEIPVFLQKSIKVSAFWHSIIIQSFYNNPSV